MTKTSFSPGTKILRRKLKGAQSHICTTCAVLHQQGSASKYIRCHHHKNMALLANGTTWATPADPSSTSQEPPHPCRPSTHLPPQPCETARHQLLSRCHWPKCPLRSLWAQPGRWCHWCPAGHTHCFPCRTDCRLHHKTHTTIHLRPSPLRCRMAHR